jgi:TrmH family RNA methyltransferase
MALAGLILVEPSLAGNVGAAMRVAANFGVRRLDLVRPKVDFDDPEVLRWACGADKHLECQRWDSLAETARRYRTLAASASGRGRKYLQVLSPVEANAALADRGLETAAIVFGNETRGLSREDIDCCDLVIRVPTESVFPVLNLAQAVAILVATIQANASGDVRQTPEPAPQEDVQALMLHLEESLGTIVFLDPQNPQRILRKLRRFFGRAGINHEEVTILRGICRQMEWAAGARPGRFKSGNPDDDDG